MLEQLRACVASAELQSGYLVGIHALTLGSNLLKRELIAIARSVEVE